MSVDHSGPGDPKTAMWLAIGFAALALVLAVVLHNVFSIVLIVFAVGDFAYFLWLRDRITKD
ncbi:hypothetical protein GCM10011519_13680 [Marmoricola endophyticus]|uniref:Uncharacterized protein n=1 Tax=Marmoricola endophyticus TaxID=2040280 RepID=A0A917BH69_9ACTN|nr:hypothetical protein [Marmoricola endophyticus]GGF41197.1 hypothetical protein GCM10011519_13680 [Marmoricola endophyticus]